MGDAALVLLVLMKLLHIDWRVERSLLDIGHHSFSAHLQSLPSTVVNDFVGGSIAVLADSAHIMVDVGFVDVARVVVHRILNRVVRDNSVIETSVSSSTH